MIVNNVVFSCFILICLGIFSVFVHEIIHLFVAYCFGFKIKINIQNILSPRLIYKNNGKLGMVFLISVSPAIFQIIIAFLLPHNYPWNFLKIYFFLNIFNLLPITADGEILMYVILTKFKNRSDSEKK